MLNKYIIDAKKDILEQFDIEPDQSDGVETWEDPIYRVGFYGNGSYRNGYTRGVAIKFYMTARGDKRMSIPELRKHSEVGDYIWFEELEDSDADRNLISVYRINISKELPLDEEQYEQLQLRFG